MNMWIDSQPRLETLCAILREANAPIGIDTEFISEKRYFAQLCLVQVGCDAPDGFIEALIDPFAVDLQPLYDLCADASIEKIVHSGGQDLQIFADAGCIWHNVFDTQIAAAFLGYGHQAGLADLVKRICKGPQLSKKFQFTDWAARPLSKEQMDYALDDIRFLPQMHRFLVKKLQERGRESWAETEFARLIEKSSTRTAPEDLMWRLNVSGLNRRALGVLRELAMIRDEMARHSDKPASFIVPDLTMTQLAKNPPQNLQELRATRGMPGVREAQSREILAAIQRALALPDEELPRRQDREILDPQHDAVSTLLGSIAGARAADNDIARPYLAPRDQINELTSWWLRRDDSPEPDLPLLRDWRREIIGGELLELLDGKRVVVFDRTPGAPAVRTQ
ncbi:MAG TPA: ribonuclease D [Abditibacteriaceae bacterium]|jgi:ribonuclease D